MDRLTKFKNSLKSSLKVKNILLRELMAEFLGTMVLTTFGNAAIAQMILSRGTVNGFISVNLAFGVGVTMAILISGNISGGHVNPAMSLLFTILGRLSWKKFVLYVLAQTLGGFVSGAIVYSVYYDAINDFDKGVRAVTGSTATAGIFATYPRDFLTTGGGLWDQVFATALLGNCILAIVDGNKTADGLAPFLIGLIVQGIGLAFGFNCGYGINPARDLGPRLLTYAVGYGTEVWTAYDNFSWIPVVGPMIGASLGGIVYKALVGHHLTEEKCSKIESSSELPEKSENATTVA